MQPTESFTRKDATRRCRVNPADQRLLIKSKMGSVFVLVVYIIRKQPLQMCSLRAIT
jgi:hypothetical protein